LTVTGEGLSGVAAQHESAAADNAADTGALKEAITQAQLRAAALESDRDEVLARVGATSTAAAAAMETYKATVARLAAAREAHERR